MDQLERNSTWAYLRQLQSPRQHIRRLSRPETTILFGPSRARVLTFLMDDLSERFPVSSHVYGEILGEKRTRSCLDFAASASNTLSNICRTLGYGNSLRSLEISMVCHYQRYISADGIPSVNLSPLEKIASQSELNRFRLIIRPDTTLFNYLYTLSEVKSKFEEGVSALAQRMVTDAVNYSPKVVEDTLFGQCWVIHIERR
jgi:hypothetical protein